MDQMCLSVPTNVNISQEWAHQAKCATEADRKSQPEEFRSLSELHFSVSLNVSFQTGLSCVCYFSHTSGGRWFTSVLL